MQLFYEEEINGDVFTLDTQESNHLGKVLRKNIGDTVLFTNGKGSLFTCHIEDNNPKKCRLKIVEQIFTPMDKFHIHLAIAPTKNMDRMEWMVEKITEVGFNEITFLKTAHIERPRLKLDRLEKKLISACKQSFKTWLPVINPIVDYDKFITDSAFQTHERFIAYVDQDNGEHLINQTTPNQSYLVLIGPEGDFSPKEITSAINNGFKPCSLGKHRLRTETAGLVAVHTLNLLNNQ
ncbi:16S rRNA (uracil(1498)-N(3))-methyltransferase [Cyclobacterium qasimii]|uniref:Ribosomal RNA small subunit methyltransferase E n=2 Tax=Cyclobacterium qasimii TaxID=1350429 RepID=S7VE29_9BACT|nr:16S rRNA (uracil(1498)-N(3))-methyltransferase [Cyclobacterium qasimii]EPR67792.1 Ribosomal RNA small subunit methyltransferase E [Cyclobacterium qasimii M12-11B]GEO20382.1 ribosomal RNA small subunit methyltransferase E [Cyclobacterium qasimii]